MLRESSHLDDIGTQLETMPPSQQAEVVGGVANTLGQLSAKMFKSVRLAARSHLRRVAKRRERG